MSANEKRNHDTDYLVQCVMIVRKSRAKCGRASPIYDAPSKVPIQTEPGGGQSFCFECFRNFALLIVISSCSVLNGT